MTDVLQRAGEVEASVAARIGIVGNGWRAQFLHRAAAALPDRLHIVGVVTRSSAASTAVTRDWGVATFDSVAELIRSEQPDYVIVSVPREAAPTMILECVERGVAVLTETPPAADLAGLASLWDSVGSSRLVQVAEQYLMMPPHAARLSLVQTGAIGTPTSVHVSSTHDYHAISMIRGLLGVGLESAIVSARSFVAPLVDPLDKYGWKDVDDPRPATTVIATVDFDGAMGLYDFTDNQWHNYLRSRRLLVRGTTGELSNDDVVRLAEPHTILSSAISRRQSGYDLNLDGFDTEHFSFEGHLLWENPFPGLRLSDEEIAIATLLTRMAAFSRSEGPPRYPLADGCQDQAIALAIHESVESGSPVRVSQQVWAAGA